MKTTTLFQNLAEEMIRDWDIMPTGNGFMVVTDWRWPNKDRIEIYITPVGDREDLFVVSDGGELFNFLFAHGIDLSKDPQGMKVLSGVASNHGAGFVEYRMAKGASDKDLHAAIRIILEAVKDAAFILWHKLGEEPQSVH